MACFGNFVFGPYDATYDTASLGLVEQAWFLESQAEARDIRASRYGESIIDGIYVGQNVFMIVRLKEWTSATRLAIHPWEDDGAAQGTTDAVMGQTGSHGRCMADIAKELVLTAIAGSPANVADGPQTITAPLALYAPRHNLQIPLGNLERDVHIVFQLYPVLSTGNDAGAAVTSLDHFVTT